MIRVAGLINQESSRLVGALRDLAALLTDEKWDIHLFYNVNTLKQYLERQPLVNIICYDISSDGALEFLSCMRKCYEEAALLLIADEEVSPLVYLRPSIHADSLLLKPYGEQEAYHILEEFVSAYVDKLDLKQGKQMLRIKNEDGIVSIPYQDIFYFEAREKKIFARTRFEEYGFYDTIEQLSVKLPAVFLRCHRSFIVNTDKIHKVLLSGNLLVLRCQMEIPLSRSYKALVKEYGKEKEDADK